MQELFEAQKDTFIYPQLLALQTQKQKLKCPNKIAAFSVCVDPKCQAAGLMCRDSSCQCTKTHYKCHHIQLDRVLDIIDKHQKQIPQEVRRSYKKTHEIIDVMLDELSKIRRKLDLQEKYFGLTDYELSFMALIDEQKIDKICGKIVSELEKTFEAQISFMIKSHEEILKDFKNKKPEFDSLCKHIEDNYMKFDINKLNEELLNDSKIVNQRYEKKMMSEWLRETFIKKIWPQSYCSEPEFHKRCDEAENTLVIVKTEFDKIIGGFNPNKWYAGKDECIHDKTGKAFLFSLTLKEKYKCTDSKNIYIIIKIMDQFFGGAGSCDLYLGDNANNGFSTGGWFSTSYNLQVNGINKYQKNQQSYTLFSGALNGEKFKVKQYEVYKIQGK